VRKLLIVTAVFVAAVAVLIGFSLQPRRLLLSAARDDGSVPGAFHVHTNRSDGLSGPDEIAAAAARAGLKFVIFTDHGDGTRRPDPPAYRSGVLCLDGVEISTNGGHYIALDMPPAPYPLAGEARDVVEDVKRIGGFGIAAHPDSAKQQLRWREWTAPFDGVEMLNLDTGWRLWMEEARASAGKWPARRHLAAALLDYPFRPPETIAGLIRSGEGLLYQWAALAARRPVVGLAGVDAHARLDLRDDPVDARFALPLPGYESSFRVLSIRVRPDRALSGDAAADGAAIMRAIRGGHLYTAVDAIATPPFFEFTATSAQGTVREGDRLAAGTPATLQIASNAPPGFTTTVWNGTRIVGSAHREPQFTVPLAAGDPGQYWVEIRVPGRPRRGWAGQSTVTSLPWIRSNPIYIRSTEAPGRLPARPPATVREAIFNLRTTEGWRAEHDPASLAVVEPAPIVGGAELRLRYGLAGGLSPGRVAALAYDTPRGIAGYDRLALTVRAEHPMRVSIQLRIGDAQGETSGERWQRTVYVAPADEERTVFFDDFMPVGSTHSFRVPLGDIRSILFVIDATNAKPGDSGRVWIKRAELQR
jgi:hypothetical protein